MSTKSKADSMKVTAYRCLLVCAIGVCAPILAQVSLSRIDPIKTNAGSVAGKVLASGVRAWLGVPFAKPPVNELRWQPPQAISWQGVWTADRKMPECPQVLRPHNINNYFGEEATGEDCLYLNVWAPPNSGPNSKLPVIIFIYGGGSTIGSAGSGMYDGEQMARKGVVFVTVAYRLGILGFMAHPELTKEQGGHSGNYAYLDQLAGMKWVHENIALFGGDPARVVITGQSAGAGSVSAQMHSPLAKGLFSGAMMSSACSIAAGNTGIALAEAEKIGLEVQKKLGTSDLEHMRYVPADKLVALQAESQVGYSTEGIRVGGILDGYFMPKTKEEQARSHEMSDVPVIANFNSAESASPLIFAKTVDQYKEIARKMYGDNADDFLRLYPVKSDVEVRPMATKAAREASIAQASRNCGVQQAKYNRSKVYIDMFNYRHSYASGVEIADQDLATIGAYHNADIDFWFNNLDVYNNVRHTRDWTGADKALATDMSDALIQFAKTGNPSTQKVKWPAWSAQDDVFVNFGNPVRVERFNNAGMEWLASHPPAKTDLSSVAPGLIPGKGPRD
jgi:para-nitrobenzyl esterase